MRAPAVRRLPAALWAALMVPIACALAGAACSSPTPSDPVICTAVYVFGLKIDVRDSATGAPLGGAHGVVRDGAYVDTLRPAVAPGDTAGPSAFFAAGERAGTYTVELTRPGYRAFTRSGVVVTADACHVRPTSVTAPLQRSAADGPPR